MTVRVSIEDGLVDGDASAIEVEEGSVLDVLRQVFRSRPALAGELIDPTEGRYLTLIHLNGEDIRLLDYLKTPVKSGDELRLSRLDAADVVEQAFFLSFGPDKVKEPMLHRLGRMFQVEVNILGARVTARKGFVHVSFKGVPGEVEAVINWLARNDVGIDKVD